MKSYPKKLAKYYQVLFLQQLMMSGMLLILEKKEYMRQYFPLIAAVQCRCF